MLRRFHRAGADQGFTLVELMAAMAVFALLAGAVLTLILGATRTARMDRNRAAASSLASRELEIARNQFYGSDTGPLTVANAGFLTNPDPLPSGTAGNALVVDGTPYTVTRDVQWLPTGTGSSACDGGSTLTYPSLRVHVTVTWPRMDGVVPIVSDTLLTPPKKTNASNLGFFAVKVTDSTGAPRQNQTIQITGPGTAASDTTGTDGCAVFAVTTSGSYTASLSQAGYVDIYGNPTPTVTGTVSVGALQRVSMTYAQAVTLTASITAPAGFSLPQSLPALALYNSGIQPNGTKDYQLTSSTTTLSGLWPFSDGYTTWAGGCDQSDPAQVSGGSRNAPVVIPPGGSGTAAPAQLAGLTVTVKSSGNPVVGAVVTATQSAMTNCNAYDSPLTLGTTNASGQLLTSLPVGTWSIKTNSNKATGTRAVTVTTPGDTSGVVNWP